MPAFKGLKKTNLRTSRRRNFGLVDLSVARPCSRILPSDTRFFTHSKSTSTLLSSTSMFSFWGKTQNQTLKQSNQSLEVLHVRTAEPPFLTPFHICLVYAEFTVYWWGQVCSSPFRIIQNFRYSQLPELFRSARTSWITFVSSPVRPWARKIWISCIAL